MIIKRTIILLSLFLNSCDKDTIVGIDTEECSNICWDTSTVCSLSLCPSYFNLTIESTGESTLFIFKDSISALEIGDEIAIYDENGITNNNGDIGSVLVGLGNWNSEQLEITAISSQNLSSFGGTILPGSVNNNTLKIKIWDQSEQRMLDNVLCTIELGSGTFNGLFTAISELTIQE